MLKPIVISNASRKIGEDRVLVVKFEDLIAGPEMTGTMFEFGTQWIRRKSSEAILGQKLNAQQVGDFPHPADWSADLHARCWAEVGEVASIMDTKRRMYAAAKVAIKKGSAMGDIRGKKILVIGGAGFIGSTIVDQLTQQDVAEVIVYDNFVAQHIRTWKPL